MNEIRTRRVQRIFSRLLGDRIAIVRTYIDRPATRQTWDTNLAALVRECKLAPGEAKRIMQKQFTKVFGG